MATRSTIAVKTGDNSYKSVYAHWDGYPSNNGKILKENYTTMEKVLELISLGSISILGETIGEKVDFDTFDSSTNSQTVAYHRDRGDELTISEDTNEYDIEMQDYIYLFKDGKWFVKMDDNDEFVELTDEIIAEN